MLEALTAAYEGSGEPRYLDHARKLADLIMKQFRDPASGLLRNRAPADTETVLVAMQASSDALFDHPMPSVQATAAIALDRLAALTSDKRYTGDAAKLLAAAPDRVSPDAGTSAATLGLAIEERAAGQMKAPPRVARDGKPRG